jgi:gliding motility-associated lipoprotein GldD
MRNKFIIIVFGVLLLLNFGCKDSIYPKPYGYIRIDFPDKKYRIFDSIYPYSFEIPTYSEIIPDSSEGAEKYWTDWNFRGFNATVYLSYKDIRQNLEQYEEDTRELAYKHTIKADDIEPVIWENKDAGVYGILYNIKGDVASQIQFYLTDSINHFIRGALYFNSIPNKDSLAPSLQYLRKDIDRMIETFKWKDQILHQ